MISEGPVLEEAKQPRMKGERLEKKKWPKPRKKKGEGAGGQMRTNKNKAIAATKSKN